MKVYISADIEGVAGIAHWDEATKGHEAYAAFRQQMSDDVAAACEAALAAGASDILVKDAHGSGRNIIHDQLPEPVRVIRNWSGHPFSMLQELDESFDCVCFLGYHGAATSPHNPLSHTLTGAYAKVVLNGEICSEFHLHSHIAAYLGVPVVLISGDEGICKTAREFNPAITAVSTGVGVGASNIGEHPFVARRKIAEGMKTALRGDFSRCRITPPDEFEIQVWFTNHALAYRASFYPGAELIHPEAIAYKSDDFFEIARLMRFMPAADD